ncbi:MAG: DNA adenine methylase [Planctomycetota bacterium]|jgi:adenine-specific DNA-methyltransferase
MIKYIGSKRVLVDWIVDAIADLPGVERVCDLFSGTARVGRALKARGFAVHSNDQLSFAVTLARGLVVADAGPIEREAEAILAELEQVEPRAGWFTRDYCVDARYLRPENGARLEAMRERVVELELASELEAVVLTALMLAADRVDSTVGVQMAYLKRWAPRAARPLELRLPDLLPAAGAGGAVATCADALELAPSIEADCVYLDPPYNQHSYLGNYHVWETLVRWDRPETYGVANKRVDCRVRKSPFNRKREALRAFEQLVDSLDVPHLVVSFSDEGFLGRAEIEAVLGRERRVEVRERGHERYVGAKIGIHDPAGRRVGQVGKLANREFLFIASR